MRRSTAASFVVRKKIGTLRFICDARKATARFKEPPGVALPSGEALGRMQYSQGACLYGAGLDLKQFFRPVLISEDMRGFFALPSVKAFEVGVTTLDGAAVSGDTVLHPCFCTLPMGFSWAMWAAQAMHEELVVQSGVKGVPRADRGDFVQI